MAKDRRAIIHFGKDHDVGLVIARAGKHIRFLFGCVVRRAHVRVAISASDLEAAEFVYKENVKHAGDRIRTVNGGSAIFKNVDVIDYFERKEV